MSFTVKIHEKGKIKELSVEPGANLLQVLRKNTDLIHAPCGGKGTCGKCRVKASGIDSEPSNKEKKHLGEKWLLKGYRLACYNKVEADLEIYMDAEIEKAKILTDTKKHNVKLDPIVSKQFSAIKQPSLDDQCSDIQRVLDESSFKQNVSMELLRELPGTLRKSPEGVTFVSFEKRLVSVEVGDTRKLNYGIAVDIGTTTIAAYLYDLSEGSMIGVYSMLNPQRIYGADVISRINHTIEASNGLKELNKAIIDCINQIIKEFAEKYSVKRSNIYSIVFAGNTTMLHLLMKLPPENIAVSPFIPVTTKIHKIRAAELGIRINPKGYGVVLPSVSAYIGADTIAAVLSTRMYESEKVTLLVDLGTNGEIVLGNSKWMYACSTAAGPAFEGANIRNGLGGIEGAIDKVEFVPKYCYGTIGNKKPIGICGSGIVDAVAGMLVSGIIDETGRLKSAEESSVNEDLLGRLLKTDGMNSFRITGEKKEELDIIITQKDIRELQNAKAAVAAGIQTLMKRAGVEYGDISRVMLAGGFGNYINVENALTIGLIPKQLKGRIESVGNAAGAGAVESLLSLKMMKRAEEIKEKIRYIELSADDSFMDVYVNNMMFQVE